MIHLATHAVASSEDPNEAFIAFYPEEEEFRMFAPELAFQNLEGVELVYLSACETGSGKQSSSEGLISLARSFAIAGADQLVISQWVSEDQVSGFLATRFYHHAEKGNTYSNSLRLAKLDLLEDPKMAQFHHPFFWTNYRIIGQPEDSDGKSKLLLWLAAILLLAMVGSWMGLRYDRQKAQE
jgi:CHAT domain-containing protein